LIVTDFPLSSESAVTVSESPVTTLGITILTLAF